MTIVEKLRDETGQAMILNLTAWSVGVEGGDGGHTRDRAEANPDRSMAVHTQAVRWGTDGGGMAFLSPGHSPSQNGRRPRLREADRQSPKKIVWRVRAREGWDL